ncbi:acyl-CoA dehydrogenase family protein [Brevundimonas sp. VNH65]|uniref:acyl-CoA dehydrogenase family protein n=1 Tax=Brevundimonas sp. VNH65 TaxID=3400917 RepID=UPI003BFB6ED9
MDFEFSEEQTLLADAVNGYLTGAYDLEARRRAVASDAGWRPEVWKALAEELGVLGALVPEEAGGLGGGGVEAMIVMRAIGRALALEPYLETAVLGVGLLKRAGGAQAEALMATIAEGQAIVAFAHEEAAGRHALLRVETTARREGDGWRLDGAKAVVSAAPWASHLIVSARTSGAATDEAGIGLFLIDVASAGEGLSIRAYPTVDGRRAAEVAFDGLVLPADALLGEDAFDGVIAPALDEAVAGQCAEAVGVLSQLHDQTLDYVKQRKQFGRPIGQFQVLQHRLADTFAAVELATSLTYMATLHLDAPAAQRARAVSAAKVGVARALRFVSQAAVQTHGGIGMTDELALSHYFKRASVIEQQLGGIEPHLRRFISLTPASTADLDGGLVDA